MRYSNPIEDDGLSEEINRICGTTNAVYSNKAKVARVNYALDRYWFLAAQSAPKGTFDDTNRTALPLETQNLVDGTNAYKLTDFTNEVLEILKISVLEDDGETEIDLLREEFDNIFDFNQTYSTASADRGIPNVWTKIGDFIYLTPTPDYSETNGLRAYVSREMSKYLFVLFSVVAGTDVFTSLDSSGSAAAHGFSVGDALIFESDTTIPTGITADTVVYYVISVPTTSTFKVSTTIGGSTIDVTDTGTGNHKFLKVSKVPGIPIIHHDYLARHASLPFLVEKKLAQMPAIAGLISQDEKEILNYWENRDRDLKTIIRPRRRRYK